MTSGNFVVEVTGVGSIAKNYDNCSFSFTIEGKDKPLSRL